jgi:hypothetical protein
MIILITHATYIGWYVKFRLKLAAVMVLWKNNIADFSMKMQANSDPGNPSDWMVVTLNNDDGCDVYQRVKRSRSHKDIDHSIEENYDIVISVVGLRCGDALFQGSCNYLQTIEDVDFLQ